MLSTATLEITDLSKQKRFARSLASDDLTPEHSVGQAVELFLDQMAIPAEALRWTAISRERRLDAKQRIAELEEQDSRWMVLPEVSAGAR